LTIRHTLPPAITFDRININATPAAAKAMIGCDDGNLVYENIGW